MKKQKKTCPERAKRAKEYVIGIDGGGTKTMIALADLSGKVLKSVKTGPCSPRNTGIETTSSNIAKGINKIFKKGEVVSTFIGLPTIQEEPRFKKQILNELKKYKNVSPIFKGKIEIGSDQIVAFRSGTDKKHGVLIIAGTGCVAHGWYKNKEFHVSGWGWLEDQGSAFWTGQKVFQAIFKDLDGRGNKTIMTKMVFKKLNVENTESLLKKIYGSLDSPQVQKDFVRNVSLLSIIADNASKKGDKVAIKIMEQAGKELALSGKTVIKKMGFEKQAFPLVLVGSMFKSKIVLNELKKQIKKIAPKAKFIRPKKEPVIGAIKLALKTV